MPLFSRLICTVILSLVLGSPASAMISKADCIAIYSAAGSNAGIVVDVRGNTLTVHGSVEHQFEVEAIRRAALETGIENVVIRVFTRP